jgi:hypothetical protein
MFVLLILPSFADASWCAPSLLLRIPDHTPANMPERPSDTQYTNSLERRKNSLEFPSISLPSAGRRGLPRVSAASRGKTFWIHDAHSFDAQTAVQDSRIVEISPKNHCPSHQPRPKQALPAAHLKLQSAGPPPTQIKNVEATLMQVSRWNRSRQYFFRKWALFDVQKKGFISLRTHFRTDRLGKPSRSWK